jgi:beta-lactam-binding protein with PASTA domain
VRYFPSPPSFYGPTERVTWRDGHLELDNGYCRSTQTLEFMTDHVPARKADCKPNEVDVPSVVGDSVTDALRTLTAQPLTASYVYKPAKPGQRLGVVVAQFPRKGTLSSYDRVMLVVPHAVHGVVPKVVGLDLRRARKRLRTVKASGTVVRFVNGKAGRVLAQKPRAGVAAAPHMTVRLTLGR